MRSLMTYTVTIVSTSGQKDTFDCAGSNDQEALIYAGKVVQQVAAKSDPHAAVIVERDGEQTGPYTTVTDMLKNSLGTK